MTDTITEAHASISEAKEAEERRERHLRLSRVPFPLAGDGVFLFFGLSSLGKLEENAVMLMPDYEQRGFSGFGVYEKLLLNGHPGAIRAVLDAGLKRLDENGKPVPAVDVDLDGDLEWPVTEIVTPALEAIAYAWFGKTYSEMIAEATAAREAAAAEAREMWQSDRIGEGDAA